jgi:hypothetical protein
MTLKNIAEKYVRSRVLLDQEQVRDPLLADLKEHQKLNSRLYSIYFGAVCIVCLTAIGALVSGVATGTTARLGILAGAGVTVPAMLMLMRSSVREWSQTNLMVALARSANETQIQQILDTLLRSDLIGTGTTRLPSSQQQ